MSKIQLKLSSISQVPLQFYKKDFTFIVNGKKFKTSRIISDLLSPKICKNHFTDASLNEFTIYVRHQGDFSQILSLANFDQVDITENDLPFISEVFEILGNESIDLIKPNEDIKLTNDNIFDQIKIHEKFRTFYSKRLSEEIDFISTNFDSLRSTKLKKLQTLDINIISKILNNDKLQIENEDNLIDFVNSMYEKDKKNSILYESIEFSNVSISSIEYFISIFDINDITHQIWTKLCERITFRNQKNLPNFNLEDDNYNNIKLCEAVSLYYDNDPSTLIFIKNIPIDASGRDVGIHFLQFGEVKDCRILSESFQIPNYSLGIGIIKFATKEGQQKAVAAGKVELKYSSSSEKHVLNISKARKNNKYDTAVIEFIPNGANENDIINAFKKIKPIHVEILQDYSRSMTIAYAKFKSPDCLNSAIQYNEKIIIGQTESKVSISMAD